MSIARPFPFERLPEISRDEIAARRALVAAATTLCDTGALATALTELAEAPSSARIRRARRHDPSSVPPDDVAVLLAPADEVSTHGAVLVHVEPALASTLVSRALRQRPPRVVAPGHPPSAEVAGAFAAVLHAALRRSHAGIPLRVVSAGAAQAMARDLACGARGERSLATAWLAVEIGGESFDARVSVRATELPPPQEPRLSRAALDALGDAPLSVPLVAASCVATRADLSVSRLGDVLVVPGFPLEEDDGQLCGRVAIVPPTSERGLAAELGRDLAGREQLVIRTERIESHPWDPGDRGDPRRMTRGASNEEQAMPKATGDPETSTIEMLDDAAVVVRIELGVVEMKAREWAALSNGDVITLGRKLGDAAVLRVGGVEVARGELVQVEGEYGVRILRRGEAR